MQSEQKWTGTHTPEPWMVGCDEAMRFTYATQIVGRESTQTFVMAQFNGNFPDWSKANASRAVQCVNACKGIKDPAAEIAQLRLDCKALAAEVRLRRATPESSPGEIWEAMEAVDASSALTRHAGEREMSSAKKMIGNLPKTGDGFPIGVGGRVWFVGGLPEDKPADWAEVQSVSKDEIRLRPVQRVTWLHPSCCYSTKQNAIAMTTRPKSLRRKRT